MTDEVKTVYQENDTNLDFPISIENEKKKKNQTSFFHSFELSESIQRTKKRF